MLPASIPESLWAEFRLMRKKIKHPMTEYAETLILAKLERWQRENGANPVDILNEAIEKSWRGVFLNGHGSRPEKQREAFGTTSGGILPGATNSCCLCGKSLQSGFVHSSKGRKCHDC